MHHNQLVEKKLFCGKAVDKPIVYKHRNICLAIDMIAVDKSSLN